MSILGYVFEILFLRKYITAKAGSKRENSCVYEYYIDFSNWNVLLVKYYFSLFYSLSIFIISVAQWGYERPGRHLLGDSVFLMKEPFLLKHTHKQSL